MSDDNHEQFESQPKSAYDHLREAGLIRDTGEIDKGRFMEAAANWTEESEVGFEKWNDDELQQMIIAMDPRHPDEFEWQQHFADILRKREAARREEL